MGNQVGWHYPEAHHKGFLHVLEIRIKYNIQKYTGKNSTQRWYKNITHCPCSTTMWSNTKKFQETGTSFTQTDVWKSIKRSKDTISFFDLRPPARRTQKTAGHKDGRSFRWLVHASGYEAWEVWCCKFREDGTAMLMLAFTAPFFIQVGPGCLVAQDAQTGHILPTPNSAFERTRMLEGKTTLFSQTSAWVGRCSTPT